MSWLRKYKLKCGKPGGKGFETDVLRIAFSVSRSEEKTGNSATLSVWNLNPEHEAMVCEKDCYVEIAVGYEDTPLITIFKGNVTYGEEYTLDIAIPKMTQFHTGIVRTREIKRVCECETVLIDWAKPLNFSAYDMLVLSGTNVPYRQILRAFSGRVLIWVHGVHVSPLAMLTAKELARENLRIVCCDALSMRQAEVLGCGEKSILLENPIPFEPGEVKPADEYGIIISSLTTRKNFPAMIEAAKNCAPGVPVRVYGQMRDESVLRLVEQSSQLEYCGTLPHGELMEVLSKAKFMIHMAQVEGQPMAIREANGLGVPVICPDAPSYRQSVHENNIFVDVNNLQPIDTGALAALKNRRQLAKKTHEQYGLEGFRRQVMGLVNRDGNP